MHLIPLQGFVMKKKKIYVSMYILKNTDRTVMIVIYNIM